MSEPKFTPGPWRLDGNQIVARENGHEEFAVVEPTGRTVEEAIANAHLIAAAPALFEALIEARDAANELNLSGANFPREKIEAALAQALGEQHP